MLVCSSGELKLNSRLVGYNCREVAVEDGEVGEGACPAGSSPGAAMVLGQNRDHHLRDSGGMNAHEHCTCFW